MASRLIRLIAAAFAVALAAPAAAQTSVDEAEHSTVRVAVIVEAPSGRMLYGTGSGFVVAPNLVVTNAHVVAAARQQPSFGVAVIPTTGDGLLAARIIRYSPLTDLALLEFRGGPDVPPVTIATAEPHPGDAIVALGYPDVDDLQRPAIELVRPSAPSRSSGSIASLRDRAPTGDPIPTINHEAVISSGSSGGPLLDECGRVIGVNTWHARGADTLESRGVATRASQLIAFLEEAGVAPVTTDERCLTFAERVQNERETTVAALEEQNRALAAKLETADRLTRIAVVILIGGTLSLFVAVGVLGALLLRRRRAPDYAPQPAPFDPPRRSALGVAAVIGGAAVAALLILAAGVALLRMRDGLPMIGASASFSGEMACTLDASASREAGDAADTSFSVSGEMCVNGRTMYGRARDGRRFQRALLADGALDVLTIDPSNGEFRRERFSLSQGAYATAEQAVGASTAQGCESEDARAAVERRNQTLLRFAEGRPTQRIVWRCAPLEQRAALH